MQVKGKKRTIRRKKGTGKSILYFHEGTQTAICSYQAMEDRAEKEKIYVSDILPAFSKLVENLIFMHGFASGQDPYEDLKSDCITFLYETIHKFDASRGSKAFSYFNVVAKNWLIIRTKQKNKRLKRYVSLDDHDSLSHSEKKLIEDFQAIPGQDDVMIKEGMKSDIIRVLYEIKDRIITENEISCINAIITIFETMDDLDFINKRALFIYMRDLSNLNAKQLSISMSIIRKHYRDLTSTDDFKLFG